MNAQSPSRPAPRAGSVSRSWLIRLAGSLVVLAITLALLPLDLVGAALGALSLATVLPVLCAFLLLHVVAALKWRLVCGGGAAAARFVRAHLAGLAANLCLPGLAGGDVVRAGLVARGHPDPGMLITGSLADRLIDLMALVGVGAVGVVMMHLAGIDGGAGWRGLALSALVVTVLAGLLAWMPRLLAAPDALPLPAVLKPVLAKVGVAVARTVARPGTLLAAFAVSVAVQAALALLALALARTLGVGIGAGAWLFAWSLAKLLSVLPISLGGLGLREAAMAGLLAPFGADLPAVVAASLGWQAVLLLAGLTGAAIWAVTLRGTGPIAAGAVMKRNGADT